MAIILENKRSLSDSLRWDELESYLFTDNKIERKAVEKVKDLLVTKMTMNTFMLEVVTQILLRIGVFGQLHKYRNLIKNHRKYSVTSMKEKQKLYSPEYALSI